MSTLTRRAAHWHPGEDCGLSKSCIGGKRGSEALPALEMMKLSLSIMGLYLRTRFNPFIIFFLVPHLVWCKGTHTSLTWTLKDQSCAYLMLVENELRIV